jgi:flagellar capping protein FliD
MEYKLMVINKLQKNLSLLKNKDNLIDIERIIEVLKIQKDPDEIKQNIKNFIKYNDFMDRFRNTDSWRDLIPDLANVIDKRL